MDASVTAEARTTWRAGHCLNTPDQVVDFIAGATREVVDKANVGRSGDEDQYRAALARTFDAITVRLLAYPDAGFAQRLRRSLLRAEHRLPAQTRARLRSAVR